MDPVTEPPVQRSWLSRNWGWAVPVGCLGVLGTCAGIAGGLFLAGAEAVKSMGPTDGVIALAQSHPDVKESLGEGIEAVGLPQGSVNISDDTGEAEMRTTIRGSKGEGTLEYEAVRVRGEWEYQTIFVYLDGRELPIDVLLGKETPDPTDEGEPTEAAPEAEEPPKPSEAPKKKGPRKKRKG